MSETCAPQDIFPNKGLGLFFEEFFKNFVFGIEE
jgi:hypothetical protein